MRYALALQACFAPREAGTTVREIRRQMTDRQWEGLVTLAAAVVQLQEELATGQTVVVAPVSREVLAAMVKGLVGT